MAFNPRQYMMSAATLNRPRRRVATWSVGLAIILTGLWFCFRPFRQSDELLNVAFEASRDFFDTVDNAYSKKTPADAVIVRTSYAGSVAQTEALARGLVADTVCLATPMEMDRLAEMEWVVRNWRDAFPLGASPFHSTIVLLVRSGNPKGIRDWEDLHRSDVRTLVPSPKVSGAGCYGYLALWMHEISTCGHGPAAATEERIRSLYLRADVVDLGAQGALVEFSGRANADILLTWESEALRAVERSASDFEIVYPARSILAEPVVALLEPHVTHRHSRQAALAYLDFLFTEKARRIARRKGFRTQLPKEEDATNSVLPRMELISVEDAFGGWDRVREQHLGPRGSYERIAKFKIALGY